MHRLVLILFNLINTTQQPTIEPIVRHHDTVVKTTDSIVWKVPTATPTPQTSSTTCWLAPATRCHVNSLSLLRNNMNPTVEPIVRHHDTVVKTTDSIVRKVPTATLTPQTSSTTCWLAPATRCHVNSLLLLRNNMNNTRGSTILVRLCFCIA
jgi:hypothetical protein